jgi:RecB family exonuclease
MLVDDRPWPLEAERKRTWEAWTEIARLTDLLDGLRLRIRGRGDKYDQSYGGTLLDWAQKMAGTARSVERLVHRIDQDLHPDEIPF